MARRPKDMCETCGREATHLAKVDPTMAAKLVDDDTTADWKSARFRICADCLAALVDSMSSRTLRYFLGTASDVMMDSALKGKANDEIYLPGADAGGMAIKTLGGVHGIQITGKPIKSHEWSCSLNQESTEGFMNFLEDPAVLPQSQFPGAPAWLVAEYIEHDEFASFHTSSGRPITLTLDQCTSLLVWLGRRM